MTRSNAANYASMHEDPRIVRMIIPKSIKLQQDPEGYDEGEWRTQDSVPKDLILPRRKSKLSKEQITKINKHLGLNTPICTKHLDRLTKKIQNKLYGDSNNSDKSLLEENRGVFIEMERNRDKETLQFLKRKGIDASSLQEGDVFSIDLEEN